MVIDGITIVLALTFPLSFMNLLKLPSLVIFSIIEIDSGKDRRELFTNLDLEVETSQLKWPANDLAIRLLLHG